MPKRTTYTVRKVAALSGVSVRTLHFYDEIGLLKPAFVGANGYRYYEPGQLFVLQQIRFYRELGFDLKSIQRLLRKPGFDRVHALESHRRALLAQVERTHVLVRTIDRTLEHLRGDQAMKNEELFEGFSPEQQARHEQYLIERYGEDMQRSIAESRARVRHWTKEKWAQSSREFDAICTALVTELKLGKSPNAPAVQALVRRHHAWMQQFWTPTRESYTGHSQLITDSELRRAYEAHHTGLPEFIAQAIRVFAGNELA